MLLETALKIGTHDKNRFVLEVTSNPSSPHSSFLPRSRIAGRRVFLPAPTPIHPLVAASAVLGTSAIKAKLQYAAESAERRRISLSLLSPCDVPSGKSISLR